MSETLPAATVIGTLKRNQCKFLFDYDLIFINKIANKIIIIASIASTIFSKEIGSSGVIEAIKSYSIYICVRLI
jgi:GMP synthase PP-ATPase subunit